MLQFRNRTGFAGTVFASPDPDGIDSLYSVVKATFDLAQGVRPAAEQLPVTLAATHHGEPSSSSIKQPSDISLVKPQTDVLLIGQAYAPGGRAAYYVDASVTVGPVSKVVRVFGQRAWQSSGTSYAASTPEPFVSMPLVWERAFGGIDEGKKGPASETRNPVGVGFRAPDGDTPLDGKPLPNLEDPYDPISSWKQTPAPACFAPVAEHWQPRVSFAGTYDDAWQKGRAPYLPTDFDARFFQLAPPGLTHTAGYLEGGETVDLRAVTPGGWLQFKLPLVRVQITYKVAGSKEPRPTRLDTVIIEPDANRLVLVWRAALQCDKKLLKVEEITADLVAGP